VAFDRKRPRTLAHKPRTPFFSAPLESDHHGMGIPKEPMHRGQGLKAGKPVNVAKLSSCWHGSIVTSFPEKEKQVFAEFFQVSEALEG